MKKQFLVTAAAVMAILSNLPANSAVFGRPELVLAPIQRTFIPQGFDSNDNSQVIVVGAYPNSCYQVGHTQYWIDRANKKIDVEVTTYKTAGQFCLQVYVPFQQEISVGVLDPGQYTITVNQDSKATRVMNVREAVTINPDNYIYAPVTQAIRVGPREFMLRGTFHSNCLNMDEVKVQYEEGEVISVLPMAKYDGSCFETGQARAWEARFSVRNELSGDYLMHIRSLNGDAVNTVQTFSPFDL